MLEVDFICLSCHAVMRELTIEHYLMERTRQRGGVAIKHGDQGWPDRIVIIGGRHGWCEVKRPGQRLRPLQAARRRELEAVGAVVGTVDSMAGVERFLDMVESQ